MVLNYWYSRESIDNRDKNNPKHFFGRYSLETCTFHKSKKGNLPNGLQSNDSVFLYLQRVQEL